MQELCSSENFNEEENRKEYKYPENECFDDGDSESHVPKANDSDSKSDVKSIAAAGI